MEEDFVNKSKIYPWYFAAGAIFIYTALSVIPGIIGIGYSFTDWSAYSKELNFVGFQNFIDVFSGDQDYLQYILNTLLNTAVYKPLFCVPVLRLSGHIPYQIPSGHKARSVR